MNNCYFGAQYIELRFDIGFDNYFTESYPKLNEISRVSLKVGCLPNAVGKQPSIPSFNLGKNEL